MAKVEKQREAEAFLDLNEHAAEPFWEEETVQEVSAALSFELNDAAALASVQAEVQAKEAKRAAAAEARRALEKARREADKKEAADQEEALQAAEGLRLLQEEASAPRIASLRLPSDDVAHKTKSTFTSRTCLRSSASSCSCCRAPPLVPSLQPQKPTILSCGARKSSERWWPVARQPPPAAM